MSNSNNVLWLVSILICTCHGHCSSYPDTLLGLSLPSCIRLTRWSSSMSEDAWLWTKHTILQGFFQLFVQEGAKWEIVWIIGGGGKQIFVYKVWCKLGVGGIWDCFRTNIIYHLCVIQAFILLSKIEFSGYLRGSKPKPWGGGQLHKYMCFVGTYGMFCSQPCISIHWWAHLVKCMKSGVSG